MVYDLSKLSGNDKKVLRAVLTNDPWEIHHYIDLYDPAWKDNLVSALKTRAGISIDNVLLLWDEIPRCVAEKASSGLKRLYNVLDSLEIDMRFLIRRRLVFKDDTDLCFRNMEAGYIAIARIDIERVFTFRNKLTEVERKRLIAELS